MSYDQQQQQQQQQTTILEINKSSLSDDNQPKAYKLVDFENEFKLTEKKEDNDLSSAETKTKKRSRICHLFANYHPGNILKLFTIVNLFVEYDFRRYLISDLISGLTVGIMHIPAGLAYGALTSLHPIYGLYTILFPSFFYVLFCTSKHMSVGTFAIVSIMVYSSITNLEGKYIDALSAQLNNKLLNSSNSITDLNLTDSEMSSVIIPSESQILDIKLKIAIALAFWCGLIQVVLSIFQFGSISRYFSQPLLKGFNTAAAFHVFSNQLPHVFGIYAKKKNNSRFFKLIHIYINIAQRIASTNWLAVVISIISLFLLVLFKLKINEMFKKQLRNVPIPIDLILIIIGVVAVHFGKLDEKYKLAVVGEIPTGLPKPTVPDFSVTLEVLPDAIVISLVAFATSISIADLFARKHKYAISSNRELFAIGMCNLLGSFFKCFPASGALARSAVQENSGGKTQLVTLIADVIVLLVVLFLSVLLESLPKAILGCIIISALIKLLGQVTDIVHYWKLDKLDCFIWTITFVNSIVLDIDYGLWIGIGTMLFLNTFRNQRLLLTRLEPIDDELSFFTDCNDFKTKRMEKIRIVRPTQSLIYVNCDDFLVKLNELCPLQNQPKQKSMLENCAKNYCCSSQNDKSSSPDEQANLNATTTMTTTKEFDLIVIDLTQCQYVDESGLAILKTVIKDYDKDGVRVHLTNCNESVLDYFRKSNLYPAGQFRDLIYLANKDAISSFI